MTTVTSAEQQPLRILGPNRFVHFNRPVWWLPYHVTRGGVGVDCMMHAEILTNNEDPAHRVRPEALVVLDAHDIHRVGVSIPREKVLALFVVVDDPQMDYAAARQHADELGVPMLVYYDSHQPFPFERAEELHLRRGWDWISPMLYCEPGESLSVFQIRARDLVWRAAQFGCPVVPTIQMYDRNGLELDHQKLSNLQGFWMDLVRDYPEIIGLAPFAMRRRGGITSYPWLRLWYDAYASAAWMPERPAAPVHPLEVTIRDWSPKTGIAPLTVTAVAEVTGGKTPAPEIVWLISTDRDSHYTVVGRGSVLRTTFDTPGRYYLWAEATDGDDTARTGMHREIYVTPAPPTPTPTPPVPTPPTPTPPPVVVTPASWWQRIFRRLREWLGV